MNGMDTATIKACAEGGQLHPEWLFNRSRKKTCGYCRGYSGRCVVCASAAVCCLVSVYWKESPLHCSSQWLATVRGSGLFSQLASLNHFSKWSGAWWKESTCSLAPVTSGHTTSNSWWLFLLLPLRGNKGNLQNLRTTIHTWVVPGKDIQLFREDYTNPENPKGL